MSSINRLDDSSPPWKVLGFRESRIKPFRGKTDQLVSVNTMYKSLGGSPSNTVHRSGEPTGTGGRRASARPMPGSPSPPEFVFPTALTWNLKNSHPSRPRRRRDEANRREATATVDPSSVAEEYLQRAQVQAAIPEKVKKVQDNIARMQDELESANNESMRIVLSRGAARSELQETHELFQGEHMQHAALHFDEGAARLKEAEAEAAHEEAKKAEAEAMVRAALVGEQLAKEEKGLREAEILSRIAIYFSHSASFARFRRAKETGDGLEIKTLAVG